MQKRRAEEAASDARDLGWDVRAFCSALGWGLHARRADGGGVLFARTPGELAEYVEAGQVASNVTDRPIDRLYRAALAADAEFSRELARVYGKGASDARYLSGPYEDPELEAAKDRKVRADVAYFKGWT